MQMAKYPCQSNYLLERASYRQLPTIQGLLAGFMFEAVFFTKPHMPKNHRRRASHVRANVFGGFRILTIVTLLGVEKLQVAPYSINYLHLLLLAFQNKRESTGNMDI